MLPLEAQGFVRRKFNFHWLDPFTKNAKKLPFFLLESARERNLKTLFVSLLEVD